MFKDFTKEEIQTIIDSQTEENLHLEYKGAGSLGRTNSCIKEMAKDVSSFANSDGGLVIYGIKEFNDIQRKHKPEDIDPIDRTSFSKEWLEQIINSNISPKINNLSIYSISISPSNNDVVYVVDIPKSNTAHQANDKRYYKRYNFMSAPMDDYEIKDILNRQSSPELELILNSMQITYDANILCFPIILRNKSIRLAKDVKVMIEFEDSENYSFEKPDGFFDESGINMDKKIYSTRSKLEIYNGVDTHIGIFKLRLNEGINCVSIESTILCDNTYPQIDRFGILINNNVPTYNIIKTNLR